MNQINKFEHPQAHVYINIMCKCIMYSSLSSLLQQKSPLAFQVFLHRTVTCCFDQPIRTIPPFILGNVIWLKGDFGSRFSTSPLSCLVFSPSLTIWCCFTKSYRNINFLLVQSANIQDEGEATGGKKHRGVRS